MQGRDDVAAFIAGFAGDDRYIVDYLAEEVLQRQPDQVRDFLLHTSVLDRLNGPLCDAVTGRAGGKAMLEALDRGNLFLVALDDRRQWYRYHHSVRRRAESAARRGVARPPRRTCIGARATGSAEHDEPSEAIRHAIAGHQFRPGCGAGRADGARRCSGTGRRPAARLDRAAARGAAAASGRCSATATSRHCCRTEPRGSRRRLQDAERWLDAPTVAAHRGVSAGWSSWTRRVPPAAGRPRHPPCRTGAVREPSVATVATPGGLDLVEEDDDVGRGRPPP